MAVCIIQDFIEPETDRATPVYDAVTKKLEAAAAASDGFRVHAAGWTGNGFRIIEIWETLEGFQQFMQDHVMPAVREAGGADGPPPTVTTFELHNLITA